jgi:anti-sigma-K factor RskA
MTDAAGDPAPANTQAAELALGLLEGEERAAALRRVLAEPAFARDVEAWRLRFAQLFDLWPGAQAPDGLTERIDASLDGVAMPRARGFPWRLLALVSTAAAAALLVILPLRPVSVPVPQRAAEGPVLIASIASDKAGAQANAALVGALYRPESGALRVAAAPLAPADRVAQLWVIGSDGKPWSLGLLGRRTTVITLTPADRAGIAAGATLAISIEPTGGSPTGLPTGPVVGTGGLSAV